MYKYIVRWSAVFEQNFPQFHRPILVSGLRHTEHMTFTFTIFKGEKLIRNILFIYFDFFFFNCVYNMFPFDIVEQMK